jgi:hypothetical protein
MIYKLTANLLLLVHVGFIAFVIGGLVCVLIGGWRGWRWVRHPWFRLAHLAAIGLVVVQVWAGIQCPLTVWENALRRAAGETGYPQIGFIAYWVHQVIFFDLPAWVFMLIYTLFGAAVLASFLLVPPRFRARPRIARSTPSEDQAASDDDPRP